MAARMRQGRARLTRGAILAAAAEEFDRNGYTGTSVSAILQRAGITKGAFYFHFESKQALAAEIMTGQFERLQLMRAVEGLDQDALHRLLLVADMALARFAYSPAARAAVRLTYERNSQLTLPAPGPVWQRIVTGLLAEAAEQDLLRDRGTIDDAAVTINIAMLGATMVAEAAGDRTVLFDRVDAMWRTLLPSLASDEWLAGWRSSDWERRERPVLLDDADPAPQPELADQPSRPGQSTSTSSP